jgi:hypothetical protein
MAPPPTRRIEYMRLNEIRPAGRNPKRHADTLIGNSIDRFGLAELPLVDERTGRLVAGHGRINRLTAKQESGEAPPDGIAVDADGTWLVPVVRGWSSRSDVEAESYLLASNQLTTVGGWDNQGVAELLESIQASDPDLAALTGFDADELADLLKAAEPPDLDTLASEVGDPDPTDTWPIVRVRVPPHVAASWRSHLDTHSGDEVAAFAALLEVDVELTDSPPWEP